MRVELLRAPILALVVGARAVTEPFLAGNAGTGSDVRQLADAMTLVCLAALFTPLAMRVRARWHRFDLRRARAGYALTLVLAGTCVAALLAAGALGVAHVVATALFDAAEPLAEALEPGPIPVDRIARGRKSQRSIFG